MSTNALIAVLERIKQFFVLSENFKSTQFSSRETAIGYLNIIIGDLYTDNQDVIDRVVYAFGEHGCFEEIASNGGWALEYKEINKDFDKIICSIRKSQKGDYALFGDVRDGIHTDGNSYATSPGRMRISDEKWKYIAEVYRFGFLKKLRVNRQRAAVQEFISYGDTNPAIVVSTAPLLVAAYAYDLDAVVMLSFPQAFVQKYNLKHYDKLISVNTYLSEKQHYDVFYWNNQSAWADFCPNIVDFLSDETTKLATHKNNIPDNTWDHVKTLSAEYLKNHAYLQREGFWFI